MLTANKLKIFIASNNVTCESVGDFLLRNKFNKTDKNLISEIENMPIDDDSLCILLKEFSKRKYKLNLNDISDRLIDMIFDKKDVSIIKYIFTSLFGNPDLYKIYSRIHKSHDIEFIENIYDKLSHYYFSDSYVTPHVLSSAICNNNINAVKILVSCGSDVNGVSISLCETVPIIFYAVDKLQIFAFLYSHPNMDKSMHHSPGLIKRIIFVGTPDVLKFVLNNRHPSRYDSVCYYPRHLIALCREQNKTDHILEIQKYIECRKTMITEVTKIYGSVVSIINNYF